MTLLRELRYKLTALYGRHSTIMNIVGKFALALVVFLSLKRVIGGGGIFENTFLILILTLLCSIMPLAAIPVFAGAMTVGLSFGLGYDAAGAAAVLLIMLLVLFLRFAPESAFILVFVPMALYFGVPQVVPVCAALKQRMTAVLPTMSGVAVYYLLLTLNGYENLAGGGSGSSGVMERLEALANGLFGRPEMILNLIILCAVFVVTHAIRSLPIRSSYQAAAVTGSIFYPVFMLVGGRLTDVAVSPAAMALGAAASIAVSLIFVFFIYDVDYRATEYLQFEDDDYYYYVKAMPKITVRPMLDEEGEADEEEAPQ